MEDGRQQAAAVGLDQSASERKRDASHAGRSTESSASRYADLFYFTTKSDWFMLLVCAVGNAGAGAAQPLATIYFADSFNTVP